MMALLLLGACGTATPTKPTVIPRRLPAATSTLTGRATSRPVARPAASQPAAAAASRPAPPPLPTVIRCGNAASKQVALTFDDGPYSRNRQTERILAVLRAHGVKATFFLLGRMVRRHPHLVRRIAEEGHLIASHSWDHPRRASSEAWEQQLARTAQALRSAGITPSRFYRPPHGIVTPVVEALCKRLGYTIVLYTLLSSDWRRPGVKALEREVVGRLRSGGIAVLHDGGGDRRQTVEALPGIIRRLRRKGLEPVRLDALFEGGARREGCGPRSQRESGYGEHRAKKKRPR